MSNGTTKPERTNANHGDGEGALRCSDALTRELIDTGRILAEACNRMAARDEAAHQDGEQLNGNRDIQPAVVRIRSIAQTLLYCETHRAEVLVGAFKMWSDDLSSIAEALTAVARNTGEGMD